MSTTLVLDATRKTVPGPIEGMRITYAYARTVARDAYFWAWPMVNMYNRRLAFSRRRNPRTYAGILPLAPLNRIVDADRLRGAERARGRLPESGRRLWRRLARPRRSPGRDPGARLRRPLLGLSGRRPAHGQLRASSARCTAPRPGFYLLVGPHWTGEVPEGITKVFRAPTNTGFVGPRMSRTTRAEDKRAIQSVLPVIDMYPLAEFDGKMKRRDWSTMPNIPKPAGSAGEGEAHWVLPETFFDQLPQVLQDAPPLPGEEARYAEVLAVLACRAEGPALKAAHRRRPKGRRELVEPLLQFRIYGDAAATPLDARSPTARRSAPTTSPARRSPSRTSSSMRRAETKYFYQDLDECRCAADGPIAYTVTFPKASSRR